MLRYGATNPGMGGESNEDIERLIPASCDTSMAGSENTDTDVQDLLQRNHNASVRQRFMNGYFNALLILTVVLGAVAYVSTTQGTKMTTSASSGRFSVPASPVVNKQNNLIASKAFTRVPYAATASGLTVSTISNEYGEFGSNGMLSYPFLSGSFLIEPYKETTIKLSGVTEGCSYAYTVSSVSDSSNTVSGDAVVTGTEGDIKLTLVKVGEYMMTVTDSCTSEPLNQNVWVKYVRRELSTLNDVDREEFLDAFHTLWTVNTVDGQALYGERYKSLHYFASLHNDGGGNSVCDEFHGGVGFLNNHMYLSAYLEQSMQLVNPKVALHYMEYTKYFESAGFATHLENELDGGGWTELLSSKFFGANDPLTGRIVDGRWAMTPVPMVTPEFFQQHGIDEISTFFPLEEKVWVTLTNPHLNSPYGLLRSPWNYNPDPYVTRFGNVWRVPNTDVITCTCSPKCECNERYVVYKYHMGVQCTDYGQFFSSIKRKPLNNYLMTMEDDTHGIFHFTFGGVGGERAVSTINKLIGDYGFSVSNAMALAVSAQPFFKIYLASNPSHYERGGKVYPLNCTHYAWQYKYGDVSTVAQGSPGEEGGPQCDFIESYYESEESVNQLISMFFRTDPSPHDSIRQRVLGMTFEQRVEVMKLIANMFPFDGDLAGSGAAQDPLFWVAHGSVERLFQRAVFENMFSDMVYTDSETGYCSGHAADGTHAWLKGFYFVDESIKAEEVTNAQLTAYLVPDSDEYRDLVNFVYDSGDFGFCADADLWFV